jgi:hypothetical protein
MLTAAALVPKKFVSKMKMKREKKNTPVAQETSSTSLGPFFVRFPSSSPGCTRDPPYEQSLVGVGAGAGSSGVVVLCRRLLVLVVV